MHISLGGLFNICENGGGGGLHAPPEKLWRILCYCIKCLLLHNYMADSTIILYLECLKGLISHLKKLMYTAIILYLESIVAIIA